MAKLLSGTRVYGNLTVDTFVTATGNVVSTANVTGGNLTTAGLITATGNITSAANISGTYLLGNVFYATGISASKIYNGTTEANIGTSGGNANISVGGTSNVAVFATTGEYVTGLISATGNITGANLVTTGLVSTKDVSATGNAYVSGFMSVTGNLYVANVVSQGNLVVEDPLLYLTANAPYPYNYDIGFFSQFQTSPGTPTQANGYQHTGLVRDQTDSVWKLFSNVVPDPTVTVDFTNAVYDTFLAGGISSTGNITATSNVAGGNLLATTTVSAASYIGSTVSVTANITGGNVLTSGIVSGASHIGSIVSVTANITGGNLLTGGLISATSNITSAGNISGSYILGNGSQLTGLPATYANANVAAYLASGTDTSNIITTANVSGGNVLATTIVSGASLLGSIVSASANITGGNLLTGGIISGTGNATVGNISATIGSFTTFNSSQGGSVTGTLVATSANAQFFNQTNAAGYVLIAGYLSAAGNITSAANIAGGNLLITTTVSAASLLGSVASLSGNITGGNLLTGGLISATGNVTSAANITGGNILTGGIVSATGNVTGQYFLGNANIQYTAATAPVTGNLIGAQWYNTSTDVLYEWQTDGTSSYWVDITGPVIGSNGAASGTTLTNGTSNISVALNGNANINIAGTPNVAVFASTGEYVTGVVSASGNITSAANISGGNLTTTGAIYSNYNTNTANTGSFMATGGNTKGGTGYLDFLVAQNTSTGATNPYKWLRLNSTGGLEIINSAYTTNIFSLTDAGNLSISGQYQVSGKQAVNGPAFRAYPSVGQTITSGSLQKVNFGSESFDTNSNFASSRFTPTVEGYYHLNSTVRLDGASGTGECMIVLYKNGSEYSRGWNSSGTQFAASFWSMTVTDVAYANGTGDYFEIYIQQGSGASVTTTAFQNISYFSGCMMRGG